MIKIARAAAIHWPVIFRAGLYFLIASLPTFLDNTKTYADSGTRPALWKLIWIIGVSVVEGLVSVRAFYDGTVQRHKDELAAKEINNESQTTVIG